VDELDNNQLEDIVKRLHLIHTGGEIVESPLLVDCNQHHEGVALARCIPLLLEKVVDELGGIRDQVVMVFEDREHTEHRIPPNVPERASAAVQ
jgi:hypothetical protein